MKIEAYKIIEEQLSEYFSKIKFDVKKLTDLKTLFFKSEKVYKLEYLVEKKQFKLLYANSNLNCLKDDDFKELSAWLFDPEVDTIKEAKSIANDFIESLSKNSNQKVKPSKKNTSTDSSGANDIMFFINRMLTVFPELKDDIKSEKEHYEQFRSVTFCKEKILPLFLNLLKDNSRKDKIKKLCSTLNTLYNNGDLDVRAVITIVFLNSVEDNNSKELMRKELDKELILAWEAALKYKGKTVKPEKSKKKFNLFEAAREAQKNQELSSKR